MAWNVGRMLSIAVDAVNVGCLLALLSEDVRLQDLPAFRNTCCQEDECINRCCGWVVKIPCIPLVHHMCTCSCSFNCAIRWDIYCPWFFFLYLLCNVPHFFCLYESYSLRDVGAQINSCHSLYTSIYMEFYLRLYEYKNLFTSDIHFTSQIKPVPVSQAVLHFFFISFAFVANVRPAISWRMCELSPACNNKMRHPFRHNLWRLRVEFVSTERSPRCWPKTHRLQRSGCEAEGTSLETKAGRRSQRQREKVYFAEAYKFSETFAPPKTTFLSSRFLKLKKSLIPTADVPAEYTPPVEWATCLEWLFWLLCRLEIVNVWLFCTKRPCWHHPFASWNKMTTANFTGFSYLLYGV